MRVRRPVLDLYRWGVALLFCTCVLLVVAPVEAQQKKPPASDAQTKSHRVLVDRFQGTAAGMVRSGVVRDIERLKSVDVVAISKLNERGLAFGETDDSFVVVARELELSVIVSGKITTDKRRRLQLELSIRNGKDGAVLEVLTFQDTWAKGLGRKASKAIKARFLEIVAPAEVPAPAPQPEAVVPEETPAAPPETKAPPDSTAVMTPKDEPSPRAEPFSEKPARDEDSYVPPALQLRAGMLNAARSYGYLGGISGALRRYQLLRGPAFFAALGWYPGAHFSRGFGANLGVVGRFEQLFSVHSQVAGHRLATDSRAFHAGARVRIPIGNHELGVGFSYGQHQFTVADTFIPDVDYRFLRPSIDGEIKIWRLLAEAEFAGRVVLDAGELLSAEWFPFADVPTLALEAQVGAGFRVVGGLYVMAGVRWLRYSLKLNGLAQDMNPNGVAAEAIDYYLNGWAGLRFDWGSSP